MGTHGGYQTLRAPTPEEQLELARINDKGSAALTKRMKIRGPIREDSHTPDVLEEMEMAAGMRLARPDTELDYWDVFGSDGHKG